MPRQAKSTDPLWYKDAVIYELHVKSFFDSNDTGIGDFRGLIAKLDYLENLGITAIWLLPFFPSPLLDDGYDISDYFNVHPDYGTLGDFRRLLREAHKRDIRIIIELVINHTSDQHKWFQRARRARPGTVWRDFYVWNKVPEKYEDVRIIFTDFETSNWTWDPAVQMYYWHRFYSHQPDLNFDCPAVQREILRAVDFWLTMGVDGVRLNAVPYLFEREGTNCENLPETHEFLKKLRAHVDSLYPDKMLLAEANQWPDDAAQYFGSGDECHMAFHFPVMPRLFMSLRMEDRFPIIDILEQSLNIPPSCQWAMFLRNHDELTLEMVTDEERDYMYKAYAQDPRARINLGIRRRLAPLLENNRRRIELMNCLLFSLPGTPIIYYGDELGMGDNYYLGDRNGVRTPMQWSPDRNAGFSRTNPQQLYLPVIFDSEYNYTSVNVESQERNLSSLLWFMRRIIAVRKRFKAFGRGSLEFVTSDNPKVFTFLRKYDNEIVLVAANLSRYCQVTHLQLPDYTGYAVEELFSGNAFPPVSSQPYTLTLTPHTFFWFSLKQPAEILPAEDEGLKQITVNRTWENFPGRDLESSVASVLQRYIQRCRWFAAKGKKMRKIENFDHFTFSTAEGSVHILLLRIIYTDAPPQVYQLPLAFASGQQVLRIRDEHSSYMIASLKLKNAEGILYEAVINPAFHESMLNFIASHRGKPVNRLFVRRGRRFKGMLNGKSLPIPSFVLKAEQSNTSIIYEKTFFLKLYRRVEEGLNPDIELSEAITEKTDYKYIPSFAASLECMAGKESMSLGVLLEYIAAESDGWTYSLNSAERYFNHIMTSDERSLPPPGSAASIELKPDEVPQTMQDYIGGIYLEHAALLGRRVGELHLALASLKDRRELQPENFSLLYQKSLFQSFRSLTVKVLGELADARKNLSPSLQDEVDAVLDLRKTILTRLRMITERKITAGKIRIHGDLHLGQVLFTGRDFIIIDFEGEPSRTLSQRRLKYSALKDAAGMIRSFHYAAYGALYLRLARQGVEVEQLKPWADLWYDYIRKIFLHQYRQTLADSGILPGDEKDFALLLETFLLEKAVYEIGYEINNRPDWVEIPIRGILNLLKEEPTGRQSKERT